MILADIYCSLSLVQRRLSAGPLVDHFLAADVFLSAATEYEGKIQHLHR